MALDFVFIMWGYIYSNNFDALLMLYYYDTFDSSLSTSVSCLSLVIWIAIIEIN